MLQKSSIENFDANTLCNRFSFLENESLKTNITLNIQYISFLLNTYNKEKISGTLKFAISRDIIVHLASITEALLGYLISELVNSKRYQKETLLPSKYKYIRLVNICKDIEGKQILACRRNNLERDLEKDNIQLRDLNYALKRTNLISEEEFLRLEELRKQRNMIHLKGLNEDNNIFFDQEKINNAFKTLNNVLILTEKESL